MKATNRETDSLRAKVGEGSTSASERQQQTGGGSCKPPRPGSNLGESRPDLDIGLVNQQINNFHSPQTNPDRTVVGDEPSSFGKSSKLDKTADTHNHRGGRPTGKDVCLVPTDNVSALVSPTLARATKGNETTPQEAHADTNDFLARIEEIDLKREWINYRISNPIKLKKPILPEPDLHSFCKDCTDGLQCLKDGMNEALDAVEKSFDNILEEEWLEYLQTQSTPRNQESNIYLFKQQIKRKLKQTISAWKEKLK